MKKPIKLPEREDASRRYAFHFLVRTLMVIGLISLILSWDSRYADPLKIVIYKTLEYAQRAISYVI